MADYKNMFNKLSQLATNFVNKEQTQTDSTGLQKKLSALEEEYNMLKEAYARAVDQISLSQTIDFNSQAQSAYSSLRKQNEKLQKLISIERASLHDNVKSVTINMLKQKEEISGQLKELELEKKEMFKLKKMQEYGDRVEELASENADLQIKLEKTQKALAESVQAQSDLKVIFIQEQLTHEKEKHQNKITEIKENVQSAFRDIRSQLNGLSSKQDFELIDLTTELVKTQFLKKFSAMLQEIQNLKRSQPIHSNLPNQPPQSTSETNFSKIYTQIEKPLKVDPPAKIQEETKAKVEPTEPPKQPQEVIKPEPEIIGMSNPAQGLLRANSKKKRKEEDELNLEELLGTSAPTKDQIESKFKWIKK